MSSESDATAAPPPSPKDVMPTVLKCAATYSPRLVDGYVIHNEFFSPHPHFSSADLAAIRVDLKRRGTFTVKTNPATGLIQTSDTTNTAMRRQWFTDSAMAGYMQKDLDPASWAKSIVVNAAALCTQDALDAVAQTEASPAWYRQGGLLNGVFHIYHPESVEFDTRDVPIVDRIMKSADWFNQKRLESQALMLIRLCEMALESCQETPEPWALPFEQMIGRRGELILSAAFSMARFLIAANSESGAPNYRTPSASTWEEYPFKEGMTSDAAFTVLGFERLYALLYSITAPTPKLVRLRDFIHSADERLPRPTSQEQLQHWIAAGRHFVHERITTPLAEGASPLQTPVRPADTALTLLAASDYNFYPGEPTRNAEARLGLIRFCNATLLGEHGMRRYNEFELEGHKLHDSYLNVNYHQPAAERARLLDAEQSMRDYGSSDASELETLVDRQRTSRPEWSAQWTIGLTASLQALAKAKIEVLRSYTDEGHLALLRDINTELNGCINRCIASIPGKLSNQPGLRADGNLIAPYQVIEAFEYVMYEKGHGVFIPGAHTLPWSTAQLYDGLRLAEEAGALQEAMQQRLVK
jgi:hypothetical protein